MSNELTKYHLVIFQTDREDELDRGMVRAIRRRLEEVIDTAPSATEIDLWVHSPGGDAHAAYKLNLLLRSKCSRLRAIVPDYAKSAATLLVLGCDEIMMAPAAELGPLDVQLEHPSREDVTVSGLDVAGSFEFVGKTAVQLILAGGGSVLKGTGLARTEVLKAMSAFSASLLEPVVAKLDPTLVHRAASQLQVAEHYAQAMLKTRRRSAGVSVDEKRLIRRLVNDYPAHGFVIGKTEAESLGLPVSDAHQHGRWEAMCALHRRAEDNGSIIAALTDEQLEAFASGANQTQDEADDAEDQAEEGAQPTNGHADGNPN